MYRGLIDYMTYAYTFICKGRGKLPTDDIQAIATGAHTIIRNAEPVLCDGNTETADDHADLMEARKIDEHIEDMTQFLINMEIC